MMKVRTIIVLAGISASLLTALGCTEAGNKPYSLTGEQNLTADQQRWVDQQSIDEKGHYNPVLHQHALARLNQGAHD